MMSTPMDTQAQTCLMLGITKTVTMTLPPSQKTRTTLSTMPTRPSSPNYQDSDDDSTTVTEDEDNIVNHAYTSFFSDIPAPYGYPDAPEATPSALMQSLIDGRLS